MLTRLEIVNEMLASTGITPLSSEDNLHPDYAKASAKLTFVDKAVQARGWWFNRIVVDLAPNDAGEVLVPGDTLSADPTDVSVAYVRRGTKLYDPVNNTYILSKTVKTNLVQQLPLTELPDVAVLYLTAVAKFEYYLDENGEDQKAKTYGALVGVRWEKLNAAELRHADINARQSPAAASLLYRIRPAGQRSLNPKYLGGG